MDHIRTIWYQENKCFPPKSDLKDVLDLYFQSCSLEVSLEP